MERRATLYELVSFAYPRFRVPRKTLIGLPRWALNLFRDSFDFEAEAAPGGAADLGRMRAMMRTALAERFKFRYHIESRVLPVLFLVLARGGPRDVKKAPASELSGGFAFFGIEPGRLNVSARALRLGEFATQLGAVLSTPVIDRTGLTGRYDINLPPKPEPHSRIGGPMGRRAAVLRGLRTELGLTLVAGRSSVPVMVVDHVERPSPNG